MQELLIFVASDGNLANNVHLENIPNATISGVSTKQADGEHISTTISKDSSFKASDSCIMHSQATAYARLADSSFLKNDAFRSGAEAESLMDDVGLTNTLPVSAESAGLLPSHKDDMKGSDIVLEAILEAEVAHNAKEFFAQPQNQIKHE
uniref:Uncharacterized protein n=1 Tax=Rhizophora mucronata TaxID=61149 RepID=A0A2P2JY99_RHIMU